ncbi:hypothetical protein Cflav_PD3884 [Pedosphaera parvula Ellin514]|uniref:Uncharacterized protein n=1 Tax=Pedosphaera parvula (strain Ellin514) TaxID=320771 RepID=B9XG05_PEDPL|nr:hypothetical protein Cflav_PD3884 [Pedosphaera parvula Ellin514]
MSHELGDKMEKRFHLKNGPFWGCGRDSTVQGGYGSYEVEQSPA